VRTLVKVAALSVLGVGSAGAQVDLSGTWNTVRHEDQPDRGPGVGLGDYTGIPLTDGARIWAESWDASRLSMPAQQCRVHVAPYIFRGPLNLRTWEEKDPKTQEVVAIRHYISTYEQTRTIWMDGREHPPAYAPHTWMGFSTGRWVGDRLVVKTTHIKQGWHRRNGVPSSDLTTMTEHYIRHGDYLTHIAVIEDPVYLSEPMVKSQHFRVNLRALPSNNWLWPCTSVTEIATRGEHVVPHYLPGQNPHIEQYRAEVSLLIAGVEGGAPTLYPEWNDFPERRPSAPEFPVETAAPNQAPLAADEVRVWPIRDNVYMLVSRAGNSTIQIGDDGVLVVDTMSAELSTHLLGAIESVTDRPIRYVIDTHAHEENMGGNAVIAEAGSTRTGGVVVAQIGADIVETAAILAHENVLNRVSAPTGEDPLFPYPDWPTETYYNDRRDFSFNGEGVVVRHVPTAHTDGDSIVFLRRSDVISAGGVYDTTAYPFIDSDNGGSIQGTIAALNTIIDIAITDADHQGGTMIVPARGRLSDEMDVVEYRDMLVIIRDRIEDMIEHGMSVREVVRARPTVDYDARYGAIDGPWTTNAFVETIYRDLRRSE
jgi:cyclase